MDGGPRRAERSISGRALRVAAASMALVTAGVMIWGGAAGKPVLVTWGAALFAGTAVLVSGVTLTQALRWPIVPNRNASLASHVALLQTTRLTAIFYAWGAGSMQGLYLTPLTGLKWQHGWQYAAAMALLALATIAFERTLPRPLPGGDATGWRRHIRWARPLAAAQAFVGGVGVAALLISGKLWSERADWAANRVFAALAVAVLAVSAASMVAQHRLREAAP
jgi:hypothetical protein